MRALFLFIPWGVAAQTATYNIRPMQGNRFALEVIASPHTQSDREECCGSHDLRRPGGASGHCPGCRRIALAARHPRFFARGFAGGNHFRQQVLRPSVCRVGFQTPQPFHNPSS